MNDNGLPSRVRKQEAGWPSDFQRSDGLRITWVNGTLAIIHPDPVVQMVNRCPCCDKVFTTVRAAQLCADAAFPIAERS